jgi:DNA-binding CsgD family transcriptional regulator
MEPDFSNPGNKNVGGLFIVLERLKFFDGGATMVAWSTPIHQMCALPVERVYSIRLGSAEGRGATDFVPTSAGFALTLSEAPSWEALTATFDALPLPMAVKAASGEVLYGNATLQGLLRTTTDADMPKLSLDPDPPGRAGHAAAIMETRWTSLRCGDRVVLECLALVLSLEGSRGVTAYVFIETRAPQWNAAGRPRAAPGSTQADDRLADLTAREREILSRLAGGMSNKATARDLSISPRTVEVHRGRVLRKLGVHSVAEATTIAVDSGLRVVGPPTAA